MRIYAATLAVIGVGLGILWLLTLPRGFDESAMPDHAPDLANGETMFWAGGCTSCHAKSAQAKVDPLLLNGGDGLMTPFGTFYAPNISPDREDGIGVWNLVDFVNAMKLGVGRDGSHLYPAFPYTSYQRMHLEDLIDLKAFLDTLPPVRGRAPAHELPFPVSIRRGLGLWKLLYVDGETFEPDPKQDATVNRGAYLVNGPGHCGECHTPRNVFGGLVSARLLAGGPAPEGKGKIPNITSHQDGLGSWSEKDVVFMLSHGVTPSFEIIGGSMGAVQTNLSKLDQSDLVAIARYLKSVSPVAPRRN